MVIMDIVLTVLLLLRHFAEVALVIMVGVFAGAALAQFREMESSPAGPTDADTDTRAVSTPTSADDASEPQS